jgi:amino acid permease
MNDEIETPQLLIHDQQTDTSPPQSSVKNQKKLTIISILVIIIVLALVGLAAYYLLTAEPGTTEKIRDVFIIFMALESLVIGLALVVLIVQLATLINLLQNEIRPIINSTSETVNTLKGTATFVSNHLAEPIIKLNQFIAMVKKLINPK